MDPAIIGALSIGILILMILCGFHVGVALAATSFGALYLMTGKLRVASSVLEKTAYSAVMDYVFAVIPLFVLMGLLTTASGATGELFQAAERATRRMRGGLGIGTVGANAVFAAITGVSVASAAVFSRIAVPEMLRLNYERPFALGIVGASSLLGMLIPPSILMIIYGVITEQSVGRMFAAGVVPGLLVAAFLCIVIWVMVGLRPSRGGVGMPSVSQQAVTDKPGTLLRPWPVYLLIALVLGGIYGGFFTPTEAGAVGAGGAFLMLVAKRGIPGRASLEILLETGKATASIFLLLITAQMYSRMLTLSGLPADVTDWATALDLGPTAVLLIFVIILLVLGMVLDSVSILLLTMPIMFPVILTLGLDPIWFGIMAIIAIEIGLLTPPFGMVIFAMKASLPADVRIEEIYRGALPFLGVLMLALAVLIAFPALTLWLPDMLYNQTF
ncbi:TRAP transporter large permease [Roseovarius sp.]|uniref:TRAP transporter large permease n=1 Tax=Roseovarius sp. TaxID=1486281 RepID=UPI003566BA51